MSVAQKIAGPREAGDPWDIQFGDLENLKDLSSGNFGKVYRGSYFGTEVAVKKLLDVDDEFMHKYIEREMAILKALRHPNIVQFMGLSKHGNDYFIITEFIPGGDMRHLLKDASKDLPWRLRVRMALDAAQSLTYLHNKGLIHRDLKSHNLLVDDNGKVKLCDFGFSRRVGNADEPMTLCGTDEWMAPEVMLGEKYDAKADVFSFGMVLTELVTRQKPSKRPPGRKFAFDADAFRAAVPRACPPDLMQLAVECTAWDPRARPAMKDVLERLKALAAIMPEDVVAPAGAAQQSKKSTKHEMSYGTAAVVDEQDGSGEDGSGNDNAAAAATASKDGVPPPAAPLALAKHQPASPQLPPLSAQPHAAAAVSPTPAAPTASAAPLRPSPLAPAAVAPSSAAAPASSKKKKKERVIKGEAWNREGRVVRDFEGGGEGELATKKGQLVVLLGSDDEGWVKADAGGKIGWVPADRVELVPVAPPSPSAGAAAAAAAAAASPSSPSSARDSKGDKRNSSGAAPSPTPLNVAEPPKKPSSNFLTSLFRLGSSSKDKKDDKERRAKDSTK